MKTRPAELFASIRRRGVLGITGAVLLLLLCAAAAGALTRLATGGAAAQDSMAATIVIDPGHGGFDGGATGVGGLVEKELNLSVAIDLRDILRLYGYNVTMTRESDISLCDETKPRRKQTDLKARLDMINADGVTAVSIHQNSYAGSGTARGLQVFYSTADESSRQLADSIQQSVRELLQPDNSRVTKPAGSEIYILDNAKGTAVLAECGFISNPSDAWLLRDSRYRAKTAFSIAAGIVKFCQPEALPSP